MCALTDSLLQKIFMSALSQELFHNLGLSEQHRQNPWYVNMLYRISPLVPPVFTVEKSEW